MQNHTGISPIRASYNPVKTLAAVAMATTMLAAGSGPAHAFTPELQELFEDFLDCKLLLITDPDAHARECLGGGSGPSGPFNSLSTLGPANAPQPKQEEQEDDPSACPEGQVSDGEGGCEDEEEECDPYEMDCEPGCDSPCYPSCFASCYPECPVYN